jgi:hypothetical protein
MQAIWVRSKETHPIERQRMESSLSLFSASRGNLLVRAPVRAWSPAHPESGISPLPRYSLLSPRSTLSRLGFQLEICRSFSVSVGTSASASPPRGHVQGAHSGCLPLLTVASVGGVKCMKADSARWPSRRHIGGQCRCPPPQR